MPRPAPELLKSSKRWCSAFPRPAESVDAPLRALIFDSHYDAYKGVVAYVRVVDGVVRHGEPLYLMASEQKIEAIEIGVFRPDMQPVTSCKPAKSATSPPA